MVNNLYIHIPFCMRKCIYCDFFSVPYDEDLALRYIKAMTREIDLRRGTVGELKTIYIGGGTPTAMPASLLLSLIQKIKSSFTTFLGAEITIEANPGTVDRGSIRTLADAGVNRFSLGVQSFDDNTLKLLGRVHTFEDVLKSVSAVKASPIENFSMDLIYGIPGQTVDEWKKTVNTAIEITPQHISAYELTPERGTPLFEKMMKGEMEKPDEETIIEMYYHALDRLAEVGYRHYEISNFAQPGFECRHNLNYWNRGQYVGIGASAHSFIGDRRVKNTKDLNTYLDDLAEGRLPIEESTEISCEDAIKEFIFLGLRKTEGLDVRMFREELGIDILKASEELVEEGLLVFDDDHVRATMKGIVISNTVIAKLFEKIHL